MEPIWAFFKRPLFAVGETDVTAYILIAAFLTLVAFFVISMVLRRALSRWVARNEAASDSSFYIIARVLHYILIALGLMLSASLVGLDFSKLAIIAGALSVGIGFGLQTIFNNFISGIILLFDRSIKVGDFVELDASGVMGTVKEIRVRCTLLTTNDNVDVLVPNSEFVSGRVVNWTYGDRYRRQSFPFGVSYKAEPEEVIKVALAAAETVPLLLVDNVSRKMSVLMTGFGDSSLDFVLYAWVKPEAVKTPKLVATQVNIALFKALNEAGIEIPFPQRDLHIRSDSRVK